MEFQLSDEAEKMVAGFIGTCLRTNPNEKASKEFLHELSTLTLLAQGYLTIESVDGSYVALPTKVLDEKRPRRSGAQDLKFDKGLEMYLILRVKIYRAIHPNEMASDGLIELLELARMEVAGECEFRRTRSGKGKYSLSPEMLEKVKSYGMLDF